MELAVDGGAIVARSMSGAPVLSLVPIPDPGEILTRYGNGALALGFLESSRPARMYASSPEDQAVLCHVGMPRAIEPPRVCRRLYSLREWSMARVSRFSQEVRERAVRMVFEHRGEYGSEWEAMCSIAEKIGCSAETLRKWVRQTEVDSGRRGGLTSDDQARMKELERENRELRRANEILRKASAYFAQAELDRRPK